MDKVTWLTLVAVLTSCCIMPTNSSCPAPQPCSNSYPCMNPRKTCLDGFCRKCDCAEKRQCRFNSSSGLVYCDCLDSPVTGKSGSLCECAGEGCNCRDIFGFAYACTEYSNVFQMFDNRKLEIRKKNMHRYYAKSMADCRDKCENLDCNAFAWKGRGKGRKCKVYHFNDLVEEKATIVRSNKHRLMMRVCNTCLPPAMP